MDRLAILSGSGELPKRLASLREDAVLISFSGVPHDLNNASQEHAFEKMGRLFKALKDQGVTEVVMAGAMSRPPLDPAEFDPVMVGLAPRLIAAMQGGDDALLRLVIAIFEEQGFKVRGAHEIDPSLTARAGVLSGAALSDVCERDADQAIKLLNTLGPLDIGQGVVVENGLCLGIETLQGTDALLDFVASTKASLRKGEGVFVKAPKLGQDLRVDMPTIGPNTIDAVVRAGLSGIIIAANSVIIIDKEQTFAQANALGITLIARDM